MAHHRRHQQREVLSPWARKIRSNPYQLQPEELLVLRRIKFPLLRYDAPWIDQYLRLYAFARKQGHCLVPAEAHGTLGRWVVTQRRKRRTGKMSLQRQVALNRLQFCWNGAERRWTDGWNDGLAELKRFIKKHGHANVPFKSPTFRQARAFLYRQRKLYRQGRLDPKRRRVLEALGVNWSRKEKAWNDRLAELERFVDQHGHANVLKRSPALCRIVDFIQRQRTHYRQGRLDPKRQRILEALGVVLSPREAIWNRGVAEVRRFRQQHGHANVPGRNHSFHKAALFLHHQRWLYRQGRLDPRRLQILKALGVDLSPKGKD